ncbi:hypothetical protein [Streptomyces sp. P17]|uniref:hypothetical protein n=1 Tax=Streptomyces sp. P17 TaxID=3074716 RepID=UPI0028F40DA3|nr:hypothetical protein [Streptomyces sp. P17]MDT9698916.1 hypothetical protein [Streptomyces sp. P17]
MGLIDKLTGTRYPEDGVVPLSAPDVRTALLALNGPDAPYRIRNALAAEKADLVAEWRIPPSASRRLERTVKTRMLLVPERHEVRSVDEQWEVKRAGNPPRWVVSRQHSVGQVNWVERQWAYEQGADGRRQKVETFRFDSREVRDPLREVALGAGWTWRGMMLRLAPPR